MSQVIEVMHGDAMSLAAQYYSDSTDFVEIMQQNGLTDYLINAPVKVVTLAANLAGDQFLVFPPTDGITIGDIVYCAGINTFCVVINVTQTREIQTVPFCTCATATGTNRIIPAQGARLSTTVQIAPGLDNDMTLGTSVTFAVGNPTSVAIPDKPVPSGGLPSV